ncbi:MAG TPA: nitrate reductase associated protein, partial [Candidatus Binataceae bacterium]
MFRRFQFENEMSQSLACVPMPVRRKLDRIGLKVGLKQWQALSHAERAAICHLPADSAEERDAMAMFVRETVHRACGLEPKVLA